MPALPVAIATGRLLSSSLACGLNLYATVAVLGLASRFGWIELPPGLTGLGQWLLIAGATALFLAELIVAAIPIVDSIWETAHTIVRPLAAASLAFVALEAVPWPIRLAGAGAACIAALAAHTAKVGLRFVLATRRSHRILLSAAEDLTAIALAVAALAVPTVALMAASFFALMLAAFGPTLWRASSFAAAASSARLRGFFHERGWTDAHSLPLRFRTLLDAPELGRPFPRAARACLSSRAAGAYRNGWLVVGDRDAWFFHTHRLRPRRIDLGRPVDASIRHGFLADTLELVYPNLATPATVYLLKDGPPAEITLGALQLAVR